MSSVLTLLSSRSCLGRKRFHPHSSIKARQALFSDKPAPTATHQTIMQSSYQEYSEAQYSAHIGCQDMLVQSIHRWGKRIQMRDQFSANALQINQHKLKMADLGSADGSNSIQTLSVVLETLQEYRDLSSPIEIVLEEHPDSDERQLRETLNLHCKLFETHNAVLQIQMKSFYKPLFAPNSMDFIMSHLCLHWLDTADATYENWKTLHKQLGSATDTQDDKSDYDTNFVFANEKCAPPLLKEAWRKELALKHLANFFRLRAIELRPGAELFVMMVGEGHEFVCPPGRTESLLTAAMKRCIQEGTLRPQVLEKTVVPYYLRSVQDIHDACDLMNNDEKGPYFKVVDVQLYSTNTGVDISRACELFWSIHKGAIHQMTCDESASLKEALHDEFQQTFGNTGIQGKFVACILRRTSRKPWSL